MKKLTAVLCVLSVAMSLSADQVINVTTAQDVQITLAPNGPLDAPPIWTKTGSAGIVINPPDSMGAKIITSGPGTNVVTIVGLSQGNAVTNKVTVIVTAPATSLNPTAVAVPK